MSSVTSMIRWVDIWMSFGDTSVPEVVELLMDKYGIAKSDALIIVDSWLSMRDSQKDKFRSSKEEEDNVRGT